MTAPDEQPKTNAPDLDGDGHADAFTGRIDRGPNPDGVPDGDLYGGHEKKLPDGRTVRLHYEIEGQPRRPLREEIFGYESKGSRFSLKAPTIAGLSGIGGTLLVLFLVFGAWWIRPVVAPADPDPVRVEVQRAKDEASAGKRTWWLALPDGGRDKLNDALEDDD